MSPTNLRPLDSEHTSNKKRKVMSSKNQQYSWDESYICLEKFNKEFHVTNVPHTNTHKKNKDYKGLGYWDGEQRRCYHDGQLQRHPDKIQQLENIGFK